MGRAEAKVALITGAGSDVGIGAASARRLAAEGALVCLTDIDAAGAESIAASIRAQGHEAMTLAHDVTSEQDWDRAVSEVIAWHGRALEEIRGEP
jgi:NAD(P)-dependent dehydrogenase (short-subunit alcohol dehydrogenase family)